MPTNNSQTREEYNSDRWELKERPFTSSIPVFGGFIVGVRNAWNSIAAKWYVRPIVEQQNQYNRLFAELIDHFNTQLVEDAKEASDINHDIAELTAMMTSINRSLQSFEERLLSLEQSEDGDEN